MSEIVRSRSASAIADRNRQIAAARAAGEPWRGIAERFGISERQATRAAAEAARYSAATLERDPEAVADQVLRAHLRSLERLEDLAGSRNGSVAVGAARALPGAAASLLAVAERLGTVPRAGSWRWLRDSSAVFNVVLAAAEDAGVPRSALREAWERSLRPDGEATVQRMRDALGSDDREERGADGAAR